MSRLRGVLVRFAVLADVFRSPELRRAECAWAGYYVADWSAFVALSIYADDFGGAAAVGLLGLVRALPAALGVPTGSGGGVPNPARARSLRRPGGQCGCPGRLSGGRRRGGPHWAVFLRVGTAGLGAAYRPAQLALVPLLARTPQELVATNVSGVFEGLAVLIGPALAGILLTFTGAAVVLAICAAISAWAALLVARISSGPYVPVAGAARSRISAPACARSRVSRIRA